MDEAFAKKDDLSKDGPDEPHDYDGNDSDMEVLEGEFTDDEGNAVTNSLPPSAYEPPPEDGDEDGKTEEASDPKSPLKKKKKYSKKVVKKIQEKPESAKTQEEGGGSQLRPKRITRQPKYLKDFEQGK